MTNGKIIFSLQTRKLFESCLFILFYLIRYFWSESQVLCLILLHPLNAEQKKHSKIYFVYLHFILYFNYINIIFTINIQTLYKKPNIFICFIHSHPLKEFLHPANEKKCLEEQKTESTKAMATRETQTVRQAHI